MIVSRGTKSYLSLTSLMKEIAYKGRLYIMNVFAYPLVKWNNSILGLNFSAQWPNNMDLTHLTHCRFNDDFFNGQPLVEIKVHLMKVFD